MCILRGGAWFLSISLVTIVIIGWCWILDQGLIGAKHLLYFELQPRPLQIIFYFSYCLHVLEVTPFYCWLLCVSLYSHTTIEPLTCDGHLDFQFWVIIKLFTKNIYFKYFYGHRVLQFHCSDGSVVHTQYLAVTELSTQQIALFENIVVQLESH